MRDLQRVLVTGGAGFVGSHTVDVLVEHGYFVRVYDNLDPQVHSQIESRGWPDCANPAAEYIRGDVRDGDMLRQALDRIDAVIHLAAAVGVGQSMYRVHHYVDVNSLGAATLLDILANERHRVKRLVVASSMSLYGEGAYRCQVCGDVFPLLRAESQLQAREWEVHCPRCDRFVGPMPTPESKALHPTSIYAITKRDHEEMFMAFGRAYGIPTVALRYFNIYGPRQALSNPYTGVIAIFAARMLAGNPPLIYEDGLQSRDFVHVRDIAQANLLALERPEANFGIFNAGTGRPTTVLDIANTLADLLGFKGAPQIVHRYRGGDIRHCYADVSLISERLGCKPQFTLTEGLQDLLTWLQTQTADDKVLHAHAELESRGLVL